MVRFAVLLRTAPVDVPWATADLRITPLRLGVSEAQLEAVTRLAVATGQLLEPDALPKMPPPTADGDGTDAATSGAAGATDVGLRGAFFLISETRSFEGRSEVSVLGTCIAYIEKSYLVYETPRDGEGGSSKRYLKLSEWHLRGSATADAFELASAVTALGVRYTVVVTMQAASRSVATQFLSACAAMQCHRGRGRTPRPAEPTGLRMPDL